MKKIIIIILFLLLTCLSYSSQPYGFIKIFDCSDLNSLCDMKIYAKAELGTIYFSMDNYVEGYKIFLYDSLGRKLLEQNIENESSFNKEGLTNGMFIIKITDGKKVSTKRILM